MAHCIDCDTEHNAGFISTRLMGTDGVSLETAKWVEVFEARRFTCYYFAGELDMPPERSFLSPEAHFRHPEIHEINQSVFGVDERGRYLTDQIQLLKNKIKDDLYEFIGKFDIELLVIENALAIPMNIPLGLAITELLSEIQLPAIAHHHDFFWERQRFLTNAISDYMRMAFPPHLPGMQHVVINSSAGDQLSLRTGISSHIIPNVMDFETPPNGIDEYNQDVREALGIEKDELLVLQPTRVVKRKGIEHAIELVHRLGKKAKLVISHASGDEGYQYENRIREYSRLMNVDTVFVSDIINDHRGLTPDGRKIYTLNDIYPYADLVTYPSTYEGFGNAFLEAIYYKKPIVVNTYSIYAVDIKPKGFSVIEIDGYVTNAAVQNTLKVLENSKLRERLVNHNYEIASKYYSYKVLFNELSNLIVKCSGCSYDP
ncbi:MAG: glycosyltransferase family 4 protein [Desulfobacteraceae bacterium]|jgi:glycosyltransferase involved in cell wall biosynthesis|nr:glycosyltransferase family 4 protein [Desulfobacteraceae bacterium]